MSKYHWTSVRKDLNDICKKTTLVNLYIATIYEELIDQGLCSSRRLPVMFLDRLFRFVNVLCRTPFFSEQLNLTVWIISIFVFNPFIPSVLLEGADLQEPSDQCLRCILLSVSTQKFLFQCAIDLG